MTKSGNAFPADSLVQALVAEYQKELAAGDTPTTAEYLERVADEFKPALAEHLLPLEYAACFRNGWLPTVEDFKSRLPQHGDLAERVLLNTAGSQGHRYVLVRKLGQGQMGEVFLARDDIGRDVAIKVLKRAGGISEAAQRAFSEEIMAMGRLGLHRNVVALYHKDILPDGREGSTAAVMQYVPGQTLREHLDSLWGRHQNAAVPDVVQFVLGIAHGLAHIQRGRLQAHRDLKPENVILDGSQSPLIADFGLATLLSKGRTAGTVRGGTPTYMAPEQVRHFLGNDREDLHNCDIWAVGVILYESLTGELPFRGTGDELFANIECATPVPPRRLRDDPAFNAALEQICLKCLEKRPEDRFSTAADLRDALQAWLDTYQGTPKLLKEIRDFTDVRQQYEHVTERRSITDQITRFFETNAKGLLLIKGPPGKGKSGIAVELERRLARSGGHRPTAFYFRKRTADVDECVRHIYASLAIQHEISSPDTYRLPPEPDKALKALRLLLRDVASRVDSERPQVIILDALDEAQSVGDHANPYQVVTQLMAELPDHVYLVVTSRAVPELATIECDAPHHEIDLDNPDYVTRYRRDVRDYLERELCQLALAGLTEPLLDKVAQIADGNFLVARLIGNELRGRSGNIRDMEALLQELLQEKGADRLGQLYQRFVKRLWNHPRIGEYVGGVLRVLAFAEGDVTPALIRAATGLHLEQWNAVHEVLQEFLFIKTAEPAGVPEDRIRPFHSSFRDYLRNRVYNGDERSTHRCLMAACIRWQDYTDASKDYALQYALFHALGALDERTIETLWQDYAYLEAKADAGFIGSLKQDLDRVAERFRTQGNPASGLVQDFANAVWESMAFLSRHPSSLFQCMWNALWWIDSPEAKEWQEPEPHPSGGRPHGITQLEMPRFQFMEGWRQWKERKSPGFSWLRAASPATRRPGQSFFLEGHTSFISALETTSDGLTALSASGDRSLRLWDLTTARCIGKQDDTEARVDVIRFCEGDGGHGAFLGGDANGTLFLWDARSLARLSKASSHHGEVTAIAVFHRGQWAVSGGEDGCLVVLELPSLRQIAHWQTEENTLADGTVRRYPIHSVAIDPRAEEILYTAGTDIYRWNWRHNKCGKWLTGLHDGFHTLCDVSRDGSRIAAWFIENRDPEYPTSGAVLSMEALNEIAHLDEDLHHEALTEVCTLGSGCSTETCEIRLSPDGLRLAVADRAATYLVYWENPDIHSWVPVPCTEPYPPRGVNCVAFADRGFVLCGSYNHSTIYACNPRAIERDTIRITEDARSFLRGLKGWQSQSDFLLDPKGRYFVATYSLKLTCPPVRYQFLS